MHVDGKLLVEVNSVPNKKIIILQFIERYY